MDEWKEAWKWCSRRRNKRELRQRDWVSGREPAMVSPEMSMIIAPTFRCRARTLGGFWNVKTCFSSLTTLRQRTTFFFSPPWTLLTSLFPEAWKHNISQPATPTGTRAQRWKCKGYVLLDSCRQINLNMYFGHVCVPTAPEGVGMIIWHILQCCGVILGHMFTYVDLRSKKNIVQTLFLLFWSEHCLVSIFTWCREPCSQCVDAFHAQTINERSNHTGKTYSTRGVYCIYLIECKS